MCEKCNKRPMEINEKQILNTRKVINAQDSVIIAIRTGKGLKIGGKND